MSKRVLRGSDVYINWNVDIYRTDGTRVELSGISLGVQLIVREKVIDITRETHGLTITGNMITFSFLGRLQTYPGTYILKLYDKNSTSITYYTCSAFIVVDEPADDVESGSIIVDLESAILLSRVIEARGEKGEKGDPGVIGSILTIGENGNWFIDGIDTGISAYGSPGAYKSIVFTRRKTESPWKYGRPEGGSFDHPIPDNMEVMGESDIVWSDGIPDGTEMIWASMAIFTPGATQSPIWSIPQEMMDTSDYDVEFALKQGDEDTQPPAPSVEDNEDGNRHNANPRSNQIWYDPTKDDERLNGDWSHMFWRAERRLANGKWGNWVITRVKGEKGETGDKGNKSAEPRLYKRSAKTPLQPIHDDSWPSGTAIVYTFSDGKMVSDAADKKIPAGWSMLGDVPDGSDPLWVIGATAVAEYNDPDVKIFKNNWSAPTEYGSGDGISYATLELYKRSEEKPLGIRWDTFYNFEEDTLSYTDPSSQIVYTLEPNVQEPDVTIDGWRRYIPPVGDASNHLWATRAPAMAHGGGIDEIEEQEWSPPARVGGEPGKNGQRSTVVHAYRRCPLGTILTNADKPVAPSGSVTYSFEENRLLVDSIDGNWYATVPDDKDEGLIVWVSMATASCDAKYMEAEILNKQWSGPVEIGTDKINNFPLALYQRKATKPDPPDTTLYYRFSNSAVYVGSIDGPEYKANNSASFAGGWSRVEPSGSTQCWITRATAVSYEDYDDIDRGEWSDPSKHVKDGTPGAPGTNGEGIGSVVEYYKVSTKDGSDGNKETPPSTSIDPTTVGWINGSTTAIPFPNKDNPFLWCFVRWVYTRDNIVTRTEQSGAYIVRAFNDEIDIPYDDIVEDVTERINTDLSEGSIAYRVEKIEEVSSTYITDEDLSDARTAWTHDAITSSVSKGEIYWKKLSDNSIHKYDEFLTAGDNLGTAEGIAAYEARVKGNNEYSLEVIVNEMSAIRQQSDNILMAVGDGENVAAAIKLLKNAETNNGKIILTAQNVEIQGGLTIGAVPSIPGNKLQDGAITTTKIDGGAITTDKIAANAITAGQIKSGEITAEKLNTAVIEDVKLAIIDELVAGSIKANYLESSTSDGRLTTVIEPGLFNLKLNGRVVARFEVDGDGVILKFLKSDGTWCSIGSGGLSFADISATQESWTQILVIPFSSSVVNDYINNPPTKYIQDDRQFTVPQYVTLHQYNCASKTISGQGTRYWHPDVGPQSEESAWKTTKPWQHGKIFTSESRNSSDLANYDCISYYPYPTGINAIWSDDPMVTHSGDTYCYAVYNFDIVSMTDGAKSGSSRNIQGAYYYRGSNASVNVQNYIDEGLRAGSGLYFVTADTSSWDTK